MKIELNRVNEPYHFEAVGSAGVTVAIDSSPTDGGRDAGARPMELVLMGLASCSAIDIIAILRKQRQQIDDFRVVVEATRADAIPAVFETIDVKYLLKGELDAAKVERAMHLSAEKYCSVSAMLAKTAAINYTFEIL